LENKEINKITYEFFPYQMPEHGFYDPKLKKWYCSYFMDKEEWTNIHDYLPINVSEPFSTSETLE